MRNMWSKADADLLKEKYELSTADELKAMFPSRNIESIRKKARKLGLYVPKEIKFINRSRAVSGNKSSNWKGGKKITAKGYVEILDKDNRRANKNGYVLEHVAVWERENNKEIPSGYCIHHLNGNKSDNRIENLQLLTISDHTKLHNRGRKLSKEAKEKISQKAKMRFADKTRHPFYKSINITRMREMRDSGMRVNDICTEFSISKRTYYNKMKETKC